VQEDEGAGGYGKRRVLMRREVAASNLYSRLFGSIRDGGFNNHY